MGQYNKDRYGYRHREDQFHDVGDAKPGDVGDSEGTFHDRARKNHNVIVDNEVHSFESHRRSLMEVEKQTGQSEAHEFEDSVSQEDVVGSTVTVKIDDYGGTLDTLARYKNHQVHVRGGTPGEKRRITLRKGDGFLIGEPVKVTE